MTHFHIKASILWGILITWGLGILAQLSGWYVVTADTPSLIPSFTAASFIPPSIAPTFFKFNFSWIADHLSQFIVIVF